MIRLATVAQYQIYDKQTDGLCNSIYAPPGTHKITLLQSQHQLMKAVFGYSKFSSVTGLLLDLKLPIV